MRNRCSLTPVAIAGTSLSLRTIWDVDEDERYDVHRNTPQVPSRVLVRTLRGKGRLYLEPAGPREVSANTLLLVRLSQLRRYHTVGKSWRFWWFEFTSAGALYMPFDQILPVPPAREDAVDFRTLFLTLRRESSTQRRLASARFAVLMERWLARWNGEGRHGPHEEVLQHLIEMMHNKLFDSWTVHAMAAAAHMSERRFRQVFAEFAGQPPKAFYDGLRLAMAQEILRLGQGNVSEVADRFGYSSPFHFSKAFRKHFGFPPSRVAG